MNTSFRDRSYGTGPREDRITKEQSLIFARHLLKREPTSAELIAANRALKAYRNGALPATVLAIFKSAHNFISAKNLRRIS